MTDLSGAQFWQAYDVIDIWVIQDTKAGKNKFLFFYDGNIHERDSEKEIISLAKQMLKRVRGR